MNGYVHIPFCVGKCRYCAFYSVCDASPAAIRLYPARLAREAALRGVGTGLFRTLYVGGGTPSALGPEGVRALFAALPAVVPGAEVSMEVNPADVTPAMARAMRGAGVTRVSLGAQSFDPAVLDRLGRRHTVAQTEAAVACLRRSGMENLSLDLIACIPGVPWPRFRETLERAIALEPAHLSVYPLSIEPGTPFHCEREAGRLPPVDDDAVLDAVAGAASILSCAGYVRYEISNYARRGFECRHNLAVWRGEDYVGLGPAAASREGCRRRTNVADWVAWSRAVDAGHLPPGEEEVLSAGADERERFVLRLRLAEGVCVNSATACRRARLDSLVRLERLGLVRRLGSGAFALSERGREVADAVMAEF